MHAFLPIGYNIMYDIYLSIGLNRFSYQNIRYECNISQCKAPFLYACFSFYTISIVSSRLRVFLYVILVPLLCIEKRLLAICNLDVIFKRFINSENFSCYNSVIAILLLCYSSIRFTVICTIIKYQFSLSIL